MKKTEELFQAALKHLLKSGRVVKRRRKDGTYYVLVKK